MRLRHTTAALPLIVALTACGTIVSETFGNVVLPLVAPALATLSVITFLAFWNDYLWPAIICQDNCTLPPGLRLLQGQYSADYGLIMAGAVVAAAPVLVIYLLLQRYIIQSVASSGIKG